MTAESRTAALCMLKYRLNRADDVLDEYLIARLDADVEGLAQNGIRLTDSTSDIMLLVDYTAWRYNNRDKPDAMPEWLRLMRRERWLHGNVREGTSNES